MRGCDRVGGHGKDGREVAKGKGDIDITEPLPWEVQAKHRYNKMFTKEKGV